jgi:hypothetical protein
MTDHTGWHAEVWVARIDRQVSGPPKRRLVATRHAWLLCVAKWLTSFSDGVGSSRGLNRPIG